jgi:hypothetical protein
MFPKCPFIVEIAAGRDCQRNRLNFFFQTLHSVIQTGAASKPVWERSQHTAGAYLTFVKGFMESAVSTASTDRQYSQAGANFGGQGGASLGASSSGAGGASAGSSGGGGGGNNPAFGGPGGAARANPGASTPRGGGAQTGAQRGGQGQGAGSTQAKQPPTQNRQKSFSPGVSIPCSKSIVGVKIGLEGPGPNFRCWGCAKTGVGHYKGECPKFWGSKGRPLPGFNAKGELEADQWIGDEPKRATFKNWVSFLEDSGNFPTGAE